MTLKISNKLYDILKWMAQYLLPAAGTLYFALSGIWGFPYGEQVVGTITAVDTFLAVILGMSKSGYEGDGILNLNTSEDKDTFLMEFTDEDPVAAMKDRKYVTFKVYCEES